MDPLLSSFVLNGNSILLVKAFSVHTISGAKFYMKVQHFLSLIFAFICLQCDHGNGARDIVAKQDWKQVEMTDQPDSASYETTSGTEESDYITGYRTTDAKKSGYVAQGGYAAAYSYSSKQDAKDSYITSYGTKEASKDSEMEHKKHVSVFEKLTPTAYLFFVSNKFRNKNFHNGFATTDMICYEWSIYNKSGVNNRPYKSDVSLIIICQLNKLRRKCVKKNKHLLFIEINCWSLVYNVAILKFEYLSAVRPC